MSAWIDYANMGVDNEHAEYEACAFSAEVVRLLLAGDLTQRLVEQQLLAGWLEYYEFEELGVMATEHDDDETVMVNARDKIAEQQREAEEVGYISPDSAVVTLWREH